MSSAILRRRGMLLPVALVLAATAGSIVYSQSLPTTVAQEAITSADIAVSALTEQVYVAYELGERIEVVRSNDVGVMDRRWRIRPGDPTLDLAVNSRTEDTLVAMEAPKVTMKRYDEEGDRIDLWETGFTGLATDVAVHELTGEIYTAVVDNAAVTVLLMSNQGILEEAWTSGLTGTLGTVAIAPARELYVGTGVPGGESAIATVGRFTDLGEELLRWQVEAAPVGLAAGIFEDVYVVTRTDDGRGGHVYRYMQDGRLVSEWPLGSPPTDVAVGPDGMVYVANLRWGGRMLAVNKYTPSGEPRGHWMALARLHLPLVARSP